MSNRKYYLNSSSTNYKMTGEFNMSDALYEENKKDRRKVQLLEDKIKKLIGANNDAKVIFNSGSSESIATCIHWAKSINPYGMVVGSKHDHVSVKENCKVYNLNYSELLDENQYIDDRTGCIFITHVDSKTGEIYNVDDLVNNIKGYKYLQEMNSDFTNMNYKKVLQYRPLLVLDATQSITKIPIKMDKWGFDAVFWSNHKIGGDMGRGVLVINDDYHNFVPLIAGAQNGGMRGGSQSANEILRDKDIYDHVDDINKRRKQWLASVDFLESKGMKVYRPKGNHLYNTILIDTDTKCPYTILSELSQQYIYVSPKSACMTERKLNESNDTNDKNKQPMEGGDKQKPFDNAIRLSFTDGSDIDGYVLDTIAKTIKEAYTTPDNYELY